MRRFVDLHISVDKIADLEDELKAHGFNMDEHGSLLLTDTGAISRPVTPITSSYPPNTLSPIGRPNVLSSLLQRRPSYAQFLRLSSSQQVIVRPEKVSDFAPSLPLHEQLEQERIARREGEEKYASLQSELEDLTKSLFEEANKMVSQEKEARHKAEMRVSLLEKRDNDKKKRLRDLETAVGRIGRVRELLTSENVVMAL